MLKGIVKYLKMSEHHCYQKKKKKKTVVLYAWVFFIYKVWISNYFEGLVVVAFLLQLILLWNDQDGKILLNNDDIFGRLLSDVILS